MNLGHINTLPQVPATHHLQLRSQTKRHTPLELSLQFKHNGMDCERKNASIDYRIRYKIRVAFGNKEDSTLFFFVNYLNKAVSSSPSSLLTQPIVGKQVVE